MDGDSQRSEPSATSDAPPAGVRNWFRGHIVTTLTVVGTVIGIVTGVVSLLPDDSGNQAVQEEEDRVAACMRTHALPDPNEKRQVSEGRLVFRACTWPPPFGAANDGFSEVTVASEAGPGKSRPRA